MRQTGRIVWGMLYACAAMVIMMAVAPQGILIVNKWLALDIAATLMIAAFFVNRAAENRHPDRSSSGLWFLCYLLNSAANGFSVAALFIHAEYVPGIGGLLLGLLPCMGLMTFAAVLLWCFPQGRKPVLWAAVILMAAMAALSFVRGVWPVGFQRNAVLFGSLVSLIYLAVFAVTIGRGERPLLRDVAYGSFGALILVTFVVLVLISDGEALDGLDFSGGGDGAPKRKRTKGGRVL